VLIGIAVPGVSVANEIGVTVLPLKFAAYAVSPDRPAAMQHRRLLDWKLSRIERAKL